MKRIATTALLMLAIVCSSAAQNATEARKVLDKTAKVISRKEGAKAAFKISSPKIGSTSGTIAIKGNKFHARTPQAITWFDGKTQWSYLKSTDEVNVSTPNAAQQAAMNPYKYITMYKQGYRLSMTKSGTNHNIHLIAQSKQNSIQEMYIVVSQKTYVPSQVKIREGQTWTTISINNFQAVNQSDATFVFNQKEFPTAEVVDLR